MRELDLCVSGCAGAHQRLLGHLDERLAGGLVDPAAPSQLPEWSVGHVLAHLVGNAEAFCRVLEAANRGAVGAMYPAGRESRWARIVELAGADASTLVGAVRRSVWALESQWAASSAEAWQGRGQGLIGEILVADIPVRRWREVEVHRTDLGWGVTSAHWDPAYVARDLPLFTAQWLSQNGVDALPASALALGPADRLGWLLGRHRPPGLPQGLTL